MKLSVANIARAIDRRLAAVRRGEREGGLALMSTVLFMILLSGMSLVLLGVILGQIAPSYAAQKGTKTVYAAQSGLQSALGAIRSASSTDPLGDVYGDISKLPCTVSGFVDGATDKLSYDVDVWYYIEDPSGKSDSWLAVNKLGCSPAGGVSTQPQYAYVVSQGEGESNAGQDADEGNRAVAAIYKFQVSNVNIPGGLIYDFDRNYCLEAVAATVGSKVRFVTSGNCDATTKPLQAWIYDTDYQIKLAATTAEGAAGLCITDKSPSNGNAVDAQLETCRTDATRYTQLWSWTGSHSWVGQKNPISGGQSSRCMYKSDSKSGSPSWNSYYYLQVKAGCNGFSPTAEVGAGAASYGTHQIVNYKEFGRCFDITGANISAAYLISYPCKQDPTGTGSQILWNHKIYYQEPAEGQASLGNQQIKTYVDNSASKGYCVQAPTSTGGYPAFKTCNGQANQKWTRVYEGADYASSYVFIDYQGRCLSINPADRHDGNWSKLVVQNCNGSEDQKWNAPASYNDSTFGGFKEIAD